MKRTLALVLSLIFLLVLVPTTALADNDVGAYLDVTINTGTKTLFQYGTENLTWDNTALTVKLYDTVDKQMGTTLTLGSSVSTGVYVIYVNDTTIYDSVHKLYTFQYTDLGSKTLTVSYTYLPTGHTDAVTVTKTVTISVQNNILDTVTPSGLLKTTYYVGETLSLTGLVVKAGYTNSTDLVTLASDGYTVFTATTDTSADRVEVNDPITDALVSSATVAPKVFASRTETYSGSTTQVTKSGSIPITVKTAAVEMKIAYAFEDPSTLVLTELTVVKAGKTTSIIGKAPTSMFAALVLKKQA